MLALSLALAVLCGAPARAETKDGAVDPVAEFRFGVLKQATAQGGPEAGIDWTAEYRGNPFSGRIGDIFGNPRPHLGINANTSGATSMIYTGLTWTIPLSRRFYLSIDSGFAIHNGKLERTPPPRRAALGLRVLFHEAIEIGVHLGPVWSVGFKADHISNAALAEENDGLTDFGIMFSRRF